MTSNNRTALAACVSLLCVSFPLAAQGRGGRGGRGATGAPAAVAANNPTTGASFDPAQVARGEKAFGEQCGSCHGANARGGTGKADIDLLRSTMVLDDLGGREIGEFLKYGRPDKNMPKFDTIPQDVVTDMAAFLHRQITAASERGTYVRKNVFSGDAKKGEEFFNGSVGKCSTCHSATGDMKGLAAKSNDDAPTIQGLIVSGGGGGGGRGGRGRGGAAAETPASARTAITAVVTLQSGEKITGRPVTVNDFVVVVQPDSGPARSFLRNGDWPKVETHNPLQAHIDLLSKYTDDDIHNLAAYLRSLK